MAVNEVSKAIHRAAGILAAACILDMRADEFAVGTARGRATAEAMRLVADELRDLAVKTRRDAERLAKNEVVGILDPDSIDPDEPLTVEDLEERELRYGRLPPA